MWVAEEKKKEEKKGKEKRRMGVLDRAYNALISRLIYLLISALLIPTSLGVCANCNSAVV